MIRITFFIAILCLGIATNAQSVVINEIITSNSTVITDDDGSYEDWVELFNTTSEPINLDGYGLTDNSSLPFKWVFPEYWIEPGEHLLIWCSNKDRTNPDFPLHTNFAISSGGEAITLTKPNGETEDTYPPVVIPQNYSYGRETDGSAVFVIFPEPTPGDTNNTPGYTDILESPVFSVNSGFFTESFMLTISHPDPDVTIIYTTDGSDPDIDNLGGTTYQYKNTYPFEPGQLPSEEFLTKDFQSFTYNAPLEIVDRTNEPNDISTITTTYHATPSYIPSFNIFKGTVVRARAYKTGALTSGISTNTYFVTPEGEDKFSIPVISISVNENKLFDYNEGIYVAGVDFDNWRLANPDTPTLYNGKGNYDRSGGGTEQTAHFNYLVDGNEVINQRIGLRINGGGTRAYQNKSLRLYARAEHGAGTFNYPFFDTETYDSYKRLVLRNSGNDFYNTYYRDAFTHQLVEGSGLDNQAYQPTVVFINGEYWGMLNIRERLDRHYFERKYGIVEEDIEILEDGYQVDEGSDVHFQAMYSYLEDNSLTDDSNFAYIDTQMDTENFRDYFITNIFVQNTDWPGWNTLFWRKNTTYQPEAPYGNDGRWRTAVKDTDAGFGQMLDVNDHNTLEFATATDGPYWPNPAWSTLILRRLLENESFKTSFINRFADLMNTYFLSDRVVTLSNEFKARIQPEITQQIARWKAPSSFSWWNTSTNLLNTFAEERPAYQRLHIREKFDISSDLTAILDVSNDTHGYIKINTIDITPETPGVSENPYPWTGIYFHNIPITVKAVALPGFEFSHWTGSISGTDAEITFTPTEDFSVTAHFTDGEPVEEVTPIYFWMMDGNIPNDTPMTSINSSFEVGSSDGVITYESCFEGYPFENGHPNWRKGSMERRNSPTEINYMPEANNDLTFASANMRGLQIKQPFQIGDMENTMIFNFSTEGYKDIVFGFAAKDENAADAILADYSIDGGSSWTTTGLLNANSSLSSDYQLFEYDFSEIETVNNLADFKVRLRFDGQDMTVDNGDRVTFNNFSVKGIAMELSIGTINTALEFTVFPNPANDFIGVYHTYSDVDYQMFTIDGRMVKSGKLNDSKIPINDLQNGIYLLQLQADNKISTKKIVKK
ncbi:MAG: CotH kinase family protein [Flavobacteriaceae bacterium]|jgi:hypothetical protein|nr:CotH kinase family protein [Flavobacteriaceae bacterium]